MNHTTLRPAGGCAIPFQPPAVAFQNKADVDRSCVELTNIPLETGVYPVYGAIFGSGRLLRNLLRS
ncbi:MAG TPA: hypothetical protein VMQ86_03590 [Bryobacteraceae bacterium]|nr:hypothetical protein [Bryobacteraceae bacterium]